MEIREEENSKPIEIPAESLSSETLLAVIESYVLREGTDYGLRELSLEEKIKNVKDQLTRGEITLVFDISTESLTFLSREEWQRISKVHAG